MLCIFEYFFNVVNLFQYHDNLVFNLWDWKFEKFRPCSWPVIKPSIYRPIWLYEESAARYNYNSSIYDFRRTIFSVNEEDYCRLLTHDSQYCNINCSFVDSVNGVQSYEIWTFYKHLRSQKIKHCVISIM